LPLRDPWLSGRRSYRSPSIAAAPAQKSDASRAATLKGDVPQRCRVIILYGREEIAAKARGRARSVFIQSGVGCAVNWRIARCAITESRKQFATHLPPTANDPRAAEAHSQSNQLCRKLPTAEGRALPRQINKPLAVRLLAPTSVPFHCFGGGVIAAPPSGSGFCRVS
jgi:hypothetical protein